MWQRPYVFEDAIKDNKEAFIKKVEDITNYLGLDSPNSLLAVMHEESGLSPSIQNTAYPLEGGYATGLIQFTPSTAKYLGTSTDALKQMSNVEQLDYVKKYFSIYKGKAKTFTDLYLINFFPAVLGQPDSALIGNNQVSPQVIAKNNPYFDLNKDGVISIGEFRQAVLNKIPANFRNKLK